MDLSEDEIRELKESNPQLYISFLESKMQMLQAENKQIRTVSEVTKQKDAKNTKELQQKVEEYSSKVDALTERLSKTDYECDLLVSTNEQLRNRVDQIRTYLVRMSILFSNLISALSTSYEQPQLSSDTSSSKAESSVDAGQASQQIAADVLPQHVLQNPRVKQIVDEITQLITLIASSNKSIPSIGTVPVLVPHQETSNDGSKQPQGTAEPQGLTALFSSFISRFFVTQEPPQDKSLPTGQQPAQNQPQVETKSVETTTATSQSQTSRDDADADVDDNNDDNDDASIEQEDEDHDEDAESSPDTTMDTALEHIFDSLGPQALHGYVTPEVANDLYFRYSLKKLGNSVDSAQSNELIQSTSKVIMTSLHSIFPESILDEIESPLDLAPIGSDSDHEDVQNTGASDLLGEIATQDAYLPTLSDRLFVNSDVGKLGYERMPRLVDQQAFLRHQLTMQLEEQKRRGELLQTLSENSLAANSSPQHTALPSTNSLDHHHHHLPLSAAPLTSPSSLATGDDNHQEIIQLLKVSQHHDEDGVNAPGLTVASINLSLNRQGSGAEQLQDASAYASTISDEDQQYIHAINEQTRQLTSLSNGGTDNTHHIDYQTTSSPTASIADQLTNDNGSRQVGSPLYINPASLEFKLKYKKVHRDYIAEKQDIERKLIRDLSSNIITQFVQSQSTHKEKFVKNIDSLRVALKVSGDADFDVENNEQFMDHLQVLYEQQFRQDLDQQLSQNLRDKLFQVLANPNSSTANKEQAVFILERRLGVKHRPDGSIQGYQVPSSEFTSVYATSDALNEYHRIQKTRDEKLKAMAAIQLAEEKAQGKGVFHFFKDVLTSMGGR